MNYVYSMMESKLELDLSNTTKRNLEDLMTFLKGIDKSVGATEIGIKFGAILNQTRIYSEYHREVKKRWNLKQKEVAEIWKKERIKRARYLADKIAKGL